MIAWCTAGSSGANRGFGISGIPVVGNTAPSRGPSTYCAMRRFIVDRPIPWISHPETAYCQEGKRSNWGGGALPTTYMAFLLEQIDQLPIIVAIRPKSGPDLHYHRVGRLDPVA